MPGGEFESTISLFEREKTLLTVDRMATVIDVLLFHLFHTYFSLKCNLFSSPLSSSLNVSFVYGHHQISSILLKLLICVSQLHIACECDTS
jgi:hypothetical protein